MVLKRDRATYPQGYIPVGNINPPQQAPAQFQPQNPPAINPQPTYPTPPLQSNNPQVPFYPQGKLNTTQMNQGFSVAFYFPFYFLVFIVAVFFGFGGVSSIGWVLAITLFAILFFSRSKLLRQGLFMKIIIWVAVFMVVFVIFGATLR